MKTRFIFYFIVSFYLLSIGEIRANPNALLDRVEIKLSVNDVPFKPNGPKKGNRSISMPIPISAFLNDVQIIGLEFYESIGKIEIIISQDGVTVYSSSENIESQTFKSIQLPQGLPGCYLLEIKGENGAYAFAYFKL